ncbi:MAG: hypothetical protein A2904_00600 [Candidatus Staskawiczbacteria bacterium RIFCSPLOWO2_01_FULL_33_9]|uniref:ATP synthase F1 complex delta/epsilon subunit N-terminal domain-containing protein n=1 Tax=Candidatus Staskawiczbacteria bacterium RIFCSPLOWO2_01_FULL_33_9 TaxID=1802211 RepID=A0A1G2I6X5_9BACT|nr:MAG: hypothetical protein A2904_00600 [Candidatus Staskawiczbacteria bacterium RIFCSPLOWO2_01_FULL_33_9]
MKLSLYSLKKVLFQGEALSLNCKTMAGEITVLDNHASLITVLTAGVIKIVENPSANSGQAPKEYFFPIKSGFLEVRQGNEVRCIIEE